MAITGDLKPQAKAAFLDYWRKEAGEIRAGQVVVKDDQVLVPLWRWWFDESTHATATGAAAMGIASTASFTNIPRCEDAEAILADPDAAGAYGPYFSGLARHLVGSLVWFSEDWGVTMPPTQP